MYSQWFLVYAERKPLCIISSMYVHRHKSEKIITLRSLPTKEQCVYPSTHPLLRSGLIMLGKHDYDLWLYGGCGGGVVVCGGV